MLYNRCQVKSLSFRIFCFGCRFASRSEIKSSGHCFFLWRSSAKWFWSPVARCRSQAGTTCVGSSAADATTGSTTWWWPYKVVTSPSCGAASRAPRSPSPRCWGSGYRCWRRYRRSTWWASCTGTSSRWVGEGRGGRDTGDPCGGLPAQGHQAGEWERGGEGGIQAIHVVGFLHRDIKPVSGRGEGREGYRRSTWWASCTGTSSRWVGEGREGGIQAIHVVGFLHRDIKPVSGRGEGREGYRRSTWWASCTGTSSRWVGEGRGGRDTGDPRGGLPAQGHQAGEWERGGREGYRRSTWWASCTGTSSRWVGEGRGGEGIQGIHVVGF